MRIKFIKHLIKKIKGKKSLGLFPRFVKKIFLEF